MLDSKNFDLWADGYDKSVNLSDENNEYPFAGYKEILNIIYGKVSEKENGRILDIGFGTGILAKKLYDDGHEIYGIDFSDEMIKIARKKMPLAKLIKCDMKEKLPSDIKDIKFNYIIISYAIHHLDDYQKLDLINNLGEKLIKGGKILIADVAFENRLLLEKSRDKYKDIWDDEENYIVYDELSKGLSNMDIKFKAISDCGALIEIK